MFLTAAPPSDGYFKARRGTDEGGFESMASVITPVLPGVSRCLHRHPAPGPASINPSPVRFVCALCSLNSAKPRRTKAPNPHDDETPGFAVAPETGHMEVKDPVSVTEWGSIQVCQRKV